MSDRFNAALGESIRRHRDQRMTQAELAQRVGLSRTSVTNIECGRQRLLVDQLVDIAAALEVPVADLVPPASLLVPESGKDGRQLKEMPTVQRWLNATRRAAG